MAIKTLIKFIMNSPIFLIYRINKTGREFCRAGFISTAISEGVYDVLSKGPASCKDIQKAIGADFNREGLEAWLDLGVSLGELAKRREKYRIKSAFSKALLISTNDTWKAFFLARVEIFYDYIIKTPAYLKRKKQFEFSQTYGELFARSSRTVEPFLIDIVDRIIPQAGECNLLEVGCGSGIYIKRACDRNPDITVTGIELQEEVADFARENMKIWQIEDRVNIQNIDVRNFKCEKPFNIISFYNLIYYFPVNERINILRHIGSLLHPKGQLLLTTLCPENEPSIQLMNLWSSMTRGCGPLPSPDQLCDQLNEAGFDKIQIEKLMPGFFVFSANITN